MPKISAFVIALLALTALPAQAAQYQVDPNASQIAFSGSHAGAPFSGTFERFVIDIDFDPAAPAATTLRATIDLASATTGNAMFDGTLPTADWFDVKTAAHATFKSTQVEKQADGSYRAIGDLTLRGITHPIAFVFTLDREDAPEINASASFTIDRLAYDIGKKSDAKAEWVSKDIVIMLKLTAKKI